MTTATPKPSLFDEAIARKVESLFALMGCGIALALDLAQHIVGEPVRFLFPFVRVAFGLLALVMVWRYRRHPVLAAVLMLATLFLTTRVSWLQDSIPTEALLAVQGVVVAGLLARSSLPRALRLPAALTGLVLGGLAALSPDFGLWPSIIWTLGALGARPGPSPTSEAATAAWRGGTGRWWFYFRVSQVLGVVPFAFWVFFAFIPDALSWAPVAALAVLSVTILQGFAWVSMLRSIDGVDRSTFWSGLRLVVFIALGVCAVSATLQLYALAAGMERWLPYILAGTNLFFVSLIGSEGAVAVLVLSSYRSTPRVDRSRRRVTWASLLLAGHVVLTLLNAISVAYDSELKGLVLPLLTFIAAVLGQVCLWGLFATLHGDIEQASMADTFSSDPETPETGLA